MSRSLILILGDQLSPSMSSLMQGDKAGDVVLMAEVMAEASYVPHHKKKIAFVFSAMRHFAQELRSAGWTVDYVKLDDPANTGSLTGEVARAKQRHSLDHVVATEPGEWRLLEAMRGWPNITLRDDDRFLADRERFTEWAEGRTMLRMEHFYRLMRRKTGLLMDGNEPAGGTWNLDAENRAKASPDLLMPAPLRFAPDAITREVLDLVAVRFPDHFGDLEPFWFATTRAEAEAAFAHFLRHALPQFGTYQDAMLTSEKFLYHAVVSPYLNVGLLDPLDMCRAVEAEWQAGRVPLNSAEGFIRQIIGWREYVRAIYWWKMPDYAQSNALEAHRPLPSFYWSANTDMACVRACVTQTREEAYAHHIQRLMVTGNFALLAGLDPAEVEQWYLLVYADAFEWVELPNTHGMALFADGGVMASKPYAASGAYIDRMSDYCAGCRFKPEVKLGPKACPFNYLYWDFLIRNEAKLKANPRMGMPYRTLAKMEAERKADIVRHAATFLEGL